MNENHLTGIALAMTSHLMSNQLSTFFRKIPKNAFWKRVQTGGTFPYTELFDDQAEYAREALLQYLDTYEKDLKEACIAGNGREATLARMENCWEDSAVVCAFQQSRKALAFLTPAQKEKLVWEKEKENRSGFERDCLILQYDESLPDCGIRAFDIAKYASLAIAGGFLGYWQEEELLAYLDKALTAAKEWYSDLYQFALAGAVGTLYLCAGEEELAGKQRYNELKNNFANPNSYICRMERYWGERSE